MRHRILASLALLGALLATPTLAVGSTGPTRVVESFQFGSAPYVDCAGFTIIRTELTLERFLLTWYDEAGNPTLERRHVYFSGPLVNPLNGKSVVYEGHFMRTEEFATKLITVTGIGSQAKLPDGRTIRSAGLIEFDDATGTVTVHGSSFDEFDQALCAALA